MQAEPERLRNALFGKVAHLVISERQLTKLPPTPSTNEDVRNYTYEPL